MKKQHQTNQTNHYRGARAQVEMIMHLDALADVMN
jgi:hypothetical protein